MKMKMRMSKNLKIILYIASVIIVVCLVLLLGNHLPILAKGAIMTMSWFPTYLAVRAIGLSKSTYKKKKKICLRITAKLYTVLVFLVLDLYYWSLASNSGSLIKNIMLEIGLSVQLLLVFLLLIQENLMKNPMNDFIEILQSPLPICLQ